MSTWTTPTARHGAKVFAVLFLVSAVVVIGFLVFAFAGFLIGGGDHGGPLPS